MPAKIPKPTSWKVLQQLKTAAFGEKGENESNVNVVVKPTDISTSEPKTQNQSPASKNRSKDIQSHLESYLLAVKKTGCSSSTIRNYKSDINQFLEFTEISDIKELGNKPKLLAFAHYQRDKGLKENSIRRKLISITQFKIWLKEHNLLTSEIPLQNLDKKVDIGKQEQLERQIINQGQETKPKQTETLEKKPQIKGKKPRSRLLVLLNLISLFLFLGGLAYFGYQQFGQALISMAYPSIPNAPNRILSYQGRLTNTAQSPISAPTNMTFRLYDADTAGTLLWSSNTCSIDPDQDGIFNANLGAGAGAGSDDDDCGGAIADSVFTENSNVWLEVQVDSETLTPRQPIRTVAYAINSETLQGLRPAEIATNSTILMMNASGEVVLGTDNPVIKAATTSSGLTIEANQVQIQTSAGSNGDIVLAPDGTGIVDIQGDLSVSGETTLVGNTYITSPNTLIFNGTTALGEITSPTDSGAYLIGAYDEFTNSNSTNVQAVLNDLDAAISAGASLFTDSGTLTYLTSTSDDFAIGANSLTAPFSVDVSANTIRFGTGSGSNALLNFYASDGDTGSLTYTTDDAFVFGGADLGLAASSYLNWGSTIGSSGYGLRDNAGTLQFKNSSGTWENIGSGTGSGDSFWLESAGALHPSNDTLDLLLGDSATASAKFAFLNMASGTPTFSTTGNGIFSGHMALGANSSVDDGSLLWPTANYRSILSLQEEVTNMAEYDYMEGITNYLLLNPSGAADATVYGIDTEIHTDSTNAANYSYIFGNYSDVFHSGSGTIASIYGSSNLAYKAAAGGVITDSYGSYNYADGATNTYGVKGEAYKGNTYQANTAGTLYGGHFNAQNTLAVSTGTDNNYGNYINVLRTGATGGTINTYGQYINMANLDNAGAGTHNAYGLYLSNVTGADNNYSIYSNGGTNYFAGNIGISTTSPDRKLEVLDATNPQLRLTHTDNSIYSDFQMNSNGDLVMNVDGVSNQLVLDNGGNVGIGLTNPDEKLTVNGSVNAEKYYDYTNKNYFLDPAAVSTALNIAGSAVIGANATASGNVTMGGQLQVGRFEATPTAVGEGAIIFNTSTDTHQCWNGSVWYNCGGTLYSNTNASVADGSYITVTHNLVTNDLLSSAWINAQGTWKSLDAQYRPAIAWEGKDTQKGVYHNELNSYSPNSETSVATSSINNGLLFDTFEDLIKTDSANTTASLGMLIGDDGSANFITLRQRLQSGRVGLIGGQTFSTGETDNDGQTYLGSNTVNDMYYYDRSKDSTPEVLVEIGIDPNWYNGVTLSVATSSATYSQAGTIADKNPNLTTSYNGSLIKATGTDSTPRTIYITIKSPTTFDWTNYQGDSATGVTITPGTAQTLGSTGVSVTFTGGVSYNVGDVFRIASWYIEPESATRGAKQQFPERSYVVATASGVDIIDADTQKLWMRFSLGSGQIMGTTGLGSASILNGVLYVGSSGGSGLRKTDFTADRGTTYGSSAYAWRGSVSERNTNITGGTLNTSTILISDTVNDIDVAVIPNQPTQEVTVSGWGYMTESTINAGFSESETVNLPYKFNSTPNILVSYAGIPTSTTNPNSLSECNNSGGATQLMDVNVNAITQNSFTVGTYQAGTTNWQNWEVCYTWTATGTVSPKQYVAAATNGGVTLINETDPQAVDFYYDSDNDVVTKVALSSRGDLYYNRQYVASSTEPLLQVYFGAAGATTDKTTNNSRHYVYFWGSTPAINTASTDDVTSISITEGTSTIDPGDGNTIYVGTNLGARVIQEKRSYANIGDAGEISQSSVKYYTTDFTSEEMIGDIRGMWPLNNTRSDADFEDISVKANTLTGTNITANGDAVIGVRGTATDFDGSTESLTRADDADLDFAASENFSIGIWFKHNGTIATNPDYIITKADTTNGGYKLYMNASGAICFDIDDDATFTPDDQACTTLRYDDSQWHHAVAVKNATSSIQIYVDGVIANQDSTIAATGTLANANAFYIGVDRDGTSNEWDGSLDEAFVTATALTPAQIKNMYQIGYRSLQSQQTTGMGSVAYTNDPAAGSNITLNISDTTGIFAGDTVIVSSSAGTEAAIVSGLLLNTNITVNSLSLNHTTTSPLVYKQSYQHLGYYNTGTDTISVIEVDTNNQYMYVGLNSTTLGGLSKIQLNSDSVTKLYTASANSPTGGATILDEDVNSLAVGETLYAVGSAASGVKSMGLDDNATATSGNFVSKTYTLPKNIGSAVLWVSPVTDSGDGSNTVVVKASNDGGSNYATCTLVSTDSNRAVAEKEYACTFSTADNELKVKFEFARGSTKTNTYITEYGISWLGETGFRVEQADDNNVRLYNFSGETQNLKLNVTGASTAALANPWTDAGSYLYATGYETLRIYDGAGTNYLGLSHDGTLANLTYNGTTVLSINSTGDLLPNTNDSQNLGSDTKRWKDLYLGGETIHIGTSLTDEGTIAYDTTNNIFQFDTDSTTNGDIAFFTDDLYLDKSTGRVGIGTTNPGSLLHLSSTAPSIRITDSDAAADAGIWTISGSTSNTLRIQALSDAGAGGGNLIDIVKSGNQISSMDFLGAAVVKNRISTTGDSFFTSGNLGIGTTTPTFRLDVNSGAAAPSSIDLTNTIAVGAGNANATSKFLGQIGFASSDVNFTAPKLVAYISAEATENYAADIDTGSIMRFFTGANDGTSPVERMAIDNNGNVGIGVTGQANQRLRINAPSTLAAAANYGLYVTANQSTANTSSNVGIYSNATYSATSGNTLSTLYGILTIPQNTSTGTVTTIYGVNSNIQNTSSGTVGTMVGLSSIPQKNGTGAVTTAVGGWFRVDNTNATGTITNAYALYIDDSVETGTITNDYGLYQTDASALNYFAGNLGVGTNGAAVNLHVQSASDTNILRLQDSDGTCSINPESGGLSISCSSDARLKSSIVDADPILDTLLTAKIRDYIVNASGDRMTGTIAQEMQLTNPNMVVQSDDGYLHVKEFSSWQIIKGIQELNTKINSLAQTANQAESSINSVGELSITGSSATTYAVATPTGPANKIAAFADIFVARLNAGLVRTKELLANRVRTNSITTSGQQLEIEANTRITGNLETQQNLKVSKDLEVTGSTKLGQLAANNASIAGTLRAAEIEVSEIDADAARFNSIESKLADLENATVSGTLYANNIEAQSISANVITGLQERLSYQIERTLSQPSLLASLLGESTTTTEEYLAQLNQELNANLATASSTLDPLGTNNQELTLIADSAFIKQYFEVNGSAYVANSLKLGQNLMISDHTVFGANFISYQPELSEGEEFTFSIQPAGLGKLSLLAGLMQLDSAGFVTINGDLKVAGALEVGGDLRAQGTLLTNLISADRPGDDINVQLASLGDDELSVERSNFAFLDENNNSVASFSASGDLSLSGSLRLQQNLSVASGSGELIAQNSRSAGQAILPAGTTEITIQSDKVEENSMIYVTPMNSTNNQVLYVKSKLADSAFTPENEAAFTVAIDYALGQDVIFNWWIVQLN